MKTAQSGFTLIELIIVIVILGALAAVALPRFIDLQDDADQAALEGVGGAMASAMAVNFAGCSVARHATGTDCVQVSTCDATTLNGILQSGIPAGYTVSETTAPTGTPTNGEPFDCSVTQTSTSNSVSFTGITAGN